MEILIIILLFAPFCAFGPYRYDADWKYRRSISGMP